MTVALSLKVHDGLVLAADSASTLSGPGGVVNIYNNANKITNLRKGLPIGTISWGLGSIGTASISTLLKDLRRRFTDDPHHTDWHLDKENYTMSAVADRVKEFLYDEHHQTAHAGQPASSEMGVVVAGYSAGEPMAETYVIIVDEQGNCNGPTLQAPSDQCGMTWHGQIEAIHRLIYGGSTALPGVLENQLGVPAAQVPGIVQTLQSALAVPLVQDAMPLQDAIDLADALVALTINYSRFTPGAPSVGGPIEIAAISKHEGFKWVKRKHYYSQEYNPVPEEG